MARSAPVHSGYTIINGTATGSNAVRVDVWVEYKQESQSIEDNQSRVIAYFYAALNPAYSSNTQYYKGCYSSFSVDGISGINLKNDGPYDFTTTTPNLLGTFDGNISHNADGTKTVAFSGSFSTLSSYISGGSVSGSAGLTTIPRATTPGVSNMTLETETSIDLSGRASASFTHTLKYAVGSSNGTLVTKTAATSYAWTPPLSLASQIIGSASGTVTITCETYSGDTLIGTKSVNKTISVPSSVVPSISAFTATPGSANATVDGWEKLVKGYSYAALSATADGAYGSTIVSYLFQVYKSTTVKQSASQAGASWNTAILTEAGADYTFKVTITDSRGRTATDTTAAFTVYDYSTPSITGAIAFRCDSGGVQDVVDGTYISAKGTFNYSTVGGDNTLVKTIEYRQYGTTPWTTAQSNPADNTAYVFGTISTAYAYEVRFTADDDLMGAVTLTLLVKPGIVSIHIRPGGAGVGIGGKAEADEFQVHLPARFKDTSAFEGDITGDGFLNKTYPVGAIYISVSSTSPATLFGGTWSAFGAGRVLVGINLSDTAFDTVEETGGAKTHTLTTAQIPSHSHEMSGFKWSSGGSGTRLSYTLDGKDPFSETTGTAGSGGAHNNLQPYIVVYMWKRTA